MLSPVSMAKSSGFLKPRWRRVRRATRHCSCAASNTAIERASIEMLTVRYVPKSLRKLLSGTHTKLSWLKPKRLPFLAATPTTVRGWPPTRIVLPKGSSAPKNASTRSEPITATGRA